MEEKKFKTALSGFNKQEVLDYINSLESDYAATKDGLSRRIAELEEKIAKQYDSIRDKNNQITELMETLENTQKESGNNFNRLSEMNIEKDELKATFSRKEADYNNRIKNFDKEIDDLKKSHEEEILSLNREHERALETYKQDNEIKRELESRLSSLEEEYKNSVDDFEIRFQTLKSGYESKISQLTRDHSMQIDELKKLHQERLSTINNEHSLKVAQLEGENQKALEIATAGAAEIKASLDSARAMEEDARKRAEEIINETKIQCEQMKLNAETEIAALRDEEMLAMESELDLRKNETYSKLRDISENLERSRDQFNREFDSLTRSLRENI